MPLLGARVQPLQKREVRWTASLVDVRAAARWRCSVGRALRSMRDVARARKGGVVSSIEVAIASGRRASTDAPRTDSDRHVFVGAVRTALRSLSWLRQETLWQWSISIDFCKAFQINRDRSYRLRINSRIKGSLLPTAASRRADDDRMWSANGSENRLETCGPCDSKAR
jgi:hypothetical protein